MTVGDVVSDAERLAQAAASADIAQIEAAVDDVVASALTLAGSVVKRTLLAFSAGPIPPAKPFMGEHWLCTLDQVEYTFKGAWVAPKAPPLLTLLGL